MVSGDKFEYWSGQLLLQQELFIYCENVQSNISIIIIFPHMMCAIHMSNRTAGLVVTIIVQYWCGQLLLQQESS